MQLPVSNLNLATMPVPEFPLAVHYVNLPTARALLNQPRAVLGVVGFGADRPAFLANHTPFIAAPLCPASGDAMFEIWTAASACQPLQLGPVMGAFNNDLAFGAVRLDETKSASLETAVEAAYLNIFDFLKAAGFAAPLRFWNYLTAITKEDDGLERYRRFNIGRHRAFAARLRQNLPPAASCIGGKQGASMVYFLAAHETAQPLENTRQISAYAYPQIYGPRSPSFSRASILRLGMRESHFISGTASITGHESRHIGNIRGQIDETIENLHTLIGAARPAASDEAWAFKIYLRNPDDHEATDMALKAAFGASGQYLYLHGDICRSELLVEIEAFRHCRSAAAGQ